MELVDEERLARHEGLAERAEALARALDALDEPTAQAVLDRLFALGTWAAAGVAVVVGFVFRHLALYRGWEEPLANEPTGAYQHDDGRPLLGRKLKGKSHRELRELGLVTEGRERGSAEPSGPGRRH